MKLAFLKHVREYCSFPLLIYRWDGVIKMSKEQPQNIRHVSVINQPDILGKLFFFLNKPTNNTGNVSAQKWTAWRCCTSDTFAVDIRPAMERWHSSIHWTQGDIQIGLLTMALFYSSASVSQHAQDPETEAVTMNSAVIYFIIFNCVFPNVTSKSKMGACNH